LGGPTGDIAQQQLTLQQYATGLTNLDPSGKAIGLALASAVRAADTSGAAGTSALTGTVAFSYQGQNFLASLGRAMPGMAMGGFVNAVPFGGVFHQGGVVPGPAGMDRMVLAKGGEVFAPPSAMNALSELGQSPVWATAGTPSSSLDPTVLRDLNENLRQLVEETRANTSALSDHTSSTSSASSSYNQGGRGGPNFLASVTPVNVGLGV
jgi:hypothetical protein